jgi:aminoglycoside phosphotransferase (APT) family kinase protein
MSALDGTPWNRASLDQSDNGALRFELGRHLAVLHSIPGTGVYGYPPARLTADTWREAFLVMTGALLDDAVRYATALPLSPLEIAKLIYTNTAALDEVQTPALVHFDIWPGNVFLALSEGKPRIQALIDHERAFWGDPLADFVTPTIVDSIRDDDPLLAGYRAAGGVVELTDGALIRDALYRVYLYLILLVENGPRQYPESEYARVRDLATAHLIRSIDLLGH